MKVLHVYRTCYPETRGGVEQVIRYITQGCQQYGVKSKVLSVSHNESYSADVQGTEVILCKADIEIASNSFSFQLFSEFKRLAQWADIIHFHYPWPTGDLLSLINKEKPSLVTYHSDIIKQKWLKKVYKPLETFFLSNVDAIVATSPQYQAQSANLLKYSKKAHVIPLAVDPEDYMSPNTNWSSDDQYRFLKSDYFLFVGVLRYYKGLHYLLDAAKKTNATIVIAGDGPLYGELEQRIANESIQNVILTGYISDSEKLKLLANCKAFVFPSHMKSEAFGVSLIEAQMLKKAIISCEISTGTSYVNIHGETGIVVSPGDADSLTNAIEELNKDYHRRSKLGQNGFNRALSLFTIEKQAQQYHQLYSAISGKSKHQ
ncbi:lipopolysaccharide biosynthesis protein RfbV [Vibrio mediterranei AK1]|uniref:glycosyltransferase n=1 Tax=Vibrio mediterranei TaxID=689 RepID=UPI0001541CD7|nr:glycosyltransferase [Vibrio mediterranei]EDL53896.1 lipopolysaccharide biosynthesis protein RfbV [Vibrio mediterranei AK1]